MIRDFENPDRKKAVIWLSYYKIICRMNDADKLKFLESILDYLFFGIEPEFDKEKDAAFLNIWDGIFPNLERSRQCSDSGTKGGKAGKGTQKPNLIGNKNASKKQKNDSETIANQKRNDTYKNKKENKNKKEEENNSPLCLIY